MTFWKLNMVVAKIRNGKRWIEETAKKIATEYHQSIDNLKWKVGKKGIEDEMYSLVFSIEKVRYVQVFREEDLSDLPQKADIKMKVERRLRDLMKSIIS